VSFIGDDDVHLSYIEGYTPLDILLLIFANAIDDAKGAAK